MLSFLALKITAAVLLEGIDMRRARFPGKSNRGSIKNRVAVRSNAAPMPGEWKLFLDETFAWEGTLNSEDPDFFSIR